MNLSGVDLKGAGFGILEFVAFVACALGVRCLKVARHTLPSLNPNTPNTMKHPRILKRLKDL